MYYVVRQYINIQYNEHFTSANLKTELRITFVIYIQTIPAGY